MRDLGTVVRGIRTPIIKENDDLENIVVESIINASKNNNFEIPDRDVTAIAEAVVGISGDNYVSVDTVAKDIQKRLTYLIESLCDLTSVSGDKGTPVVYI